MTRHRWITFTFTLLALAVSTAAPTAAVAGSLLSGYGGPGAGSQVIIGSTLIGGSSGPTSGSDGAAGTSTSTAAAGEEPGASGAGSPAPAGRTGASTGAGSKGPAAGKSKTSGGGSSPHPTYEIAPQASVEGASALGITAKDLFYAALCLCALALTGVLTAKLARPSQGALELKGRNVEPE